MDVSLIIMLVVIAFLAVLMVLGQLRRKKSNEQLQDFRDSLKVGDKVMTDTGVVGEVVNKRSVGDFNFVTLKTGSGDNVGYLEVHMNAIYFAFDESGKPIYVSQREENQATAETKETKDNK